MFDSTLIKQREEEKKGGEKKKLSFLNEILGIGKEEEKEGPPSMLGPGPGGNENMIQPSNTSSDLK